MSVAIHFAQVSKVYALGSKHRISTALNRLRPAQPATNAPKREFRALDNVSFEVSQGEVIGLIGANGAGKSTILKLMAGITRPTSGQVEMRGRVGSLIELGAGFHPELSGRENVFLNGQLMGMSRKQIGERYDQIVEFAELQSFMDTPVKYYSSGMYARLGFAVAAHMDPGILLVDEVLSVGDASFQRKSLERMLALVRSGKTVVFVSHNLYAVEHVCNNVIWIEHGRIRSKGRARDIVKEYLTFDENKLLGEQIRNPHYNDDLGIDEVQLLNCEGKSVSEFLTGDDIEVVIQYTTTEPLNGARFSVGIVDGRGLLFEARMLMDGHSVDISTGTGTLACRFQNVPLTPGVYAVGGEIWGPNGYDVILPWTEWTRFRIINLNTHLSSFTEDHSVSHLHLNAPVLVQYQWNL